MDLTLTISPTPIKRVTKVNFLKTISIHNQEKNLWELMELSPRGKRLDLLLNSLYLFSMEMYTKCRDQFREFFGGCWGLNGLTWSLYKTSAVLSYVLSVYILNVISNPPSSFSAILFLPIFSKTSARWPTVALHPSCCFHRIKRSFALVQSSLFSSSMFLIFAAVILSLGPSWRQQVSNSSLISAIWNSGITSFLALTVVVSKKKIKRI